MRNGEWGVGNGEWEEDTIPHWRIRAGYTGLAISSGEIEDRGSLFDAPLDPLHFLRFFEV